MKFITWIICSLLIGYNCFSQVAISINRIDQKGLLLDKGWSFHTGDNPSWAEANYDAFNWQSINPADDIHSLPEVKKTTVSWFRIKLQVDRSLLDKPVALVITQIGASEIYLNGILMKRFGLVSPDLKNIKTFNPKGKPVIVQFKGSAKQVLAVRYAFGAGMPYLNYTGLGNPCFSLRLQSPDEAFEGYNIPILFVTTTGFFQFGIFLFLSIIHLFFYLFYKQRSVNFYFSIYTLCQAIGFLSDFFFTLLHSATSLFILNILFLLSITSSNIFLLISVYKLFKHPNPTVIKAAVVISLITVPLYFLIYKWGWMSIYFNFAVVVLMTIWISIAAKKRDEPGAEIVLAGQTFSLLFFLVFAYSSVSNLQSNVSFFASFLYQAAFTIAFLCPPVFISLLLAKEFAETNKSLKRQLDEIESLSQKNILQEQEKQQILAFQNERLEQQVTARTVELNRSLKELTSTQTQLIQKEKMASLGELTAGIAHEIQNPLNFVNNFSEINIELIEEIQGERSKAKGERNEKLEEEILNDIKENEEKINLHGKRADAIVKGMLQHSRANTGKKEPTDINALADEYLRLAYHGLRAKDKDFNADFKTDFDASIGKIDVVPQDIGRVLLNLYNNAIYAAPLPKGGFKEGHQPTVWVSTKKDGDKVIIRVKDNGPGIPQNIVDKIFQPFFTTKPTGQGTGLGLSLSYDIVKAHGGEIKVETKEGEGAEFIIQLPIIN